MNELEITAEQLEFLNREFGLTLDDLNGLDDDGWEKSTTTVQTLKLKSQWIILTRRRNDAVLQQTS